MKKLVFRVNQYNRNSISSLIGYLKEHPPVEIDVHVAWSVNELLHSYPNGPTYLAYSFNSWQKQEVFFEVQNLKAKWPDTIFIAGGPHTTAGRQDVLKNGFDKAFVGEGEISLSYFLKHPNHHFPRIITAHEPKITLDEIDPFLPQFKLTPPLEITRGCFYNCKYCQVPKHFHHHVRHRSISSIEKWLKNMATTSTNRIRFISPNAFSYGSYKAGETNAEAIAALLEAAKRLTKKPVFFGTFPSEVRPDNCKPELIKLIKKYCQNRKIYLGAQTGSERLLQNMGRGHKVEHVLEAVKCIRQFDLIPVVDFIFGLPLEQEEDRILTRQFIKLLVNDYHCEIRPHTFLPLPGTLWQHEPKGKILDYDIAMLNKINAGGKLNGDWETHTTKNVLGGEAAEWQTHS